MSVKCEESKHIFIHVPKCGGSSMENPTISWNTKNGGGHATISDYAAKVDINSYFKWSFVRNPYDRIISAFETCPEIQQYILDFNEFIEILYKNIDSVKSAKNIGWNASLSDLGLPVKRIHFYPMFPLLTYNDELCMDFIGRFENIHRDWETLCNMLNKPVIPLPHDRQRKSHKVTKDMLPEHIKQKICDIYEIDFINFSYAK